MSGSAPMQIPAGTENQDRGSAIMLIFWIQASVAMAIVATRFVARMLIKSVGVDDWLMLFTLCIFVVWTCLLTYNATLGGFRHIYSLTQAQGLAILRINYIIQVVIVFSYITGKAAVGFLVLRIMGPNSVYRKWLIYGVMALTAIVGSLDCIFTYTQCDPPRALWDPTIPHHCWDPSVQTNFAIFTSSENILADVVLACVPATIIYRLNMDLKKRISLCVLLGLGLVAAACGIIKTNFLAELSSRTDLTWATYDLIVWSGSELFVIIVCGSIPPLKPLWDRLFAAAPSKGYLSYGSQNSQQSQHSAAAGRAYPYPVQRGNEDASPRAREIKATTRIDVDLASMRDRHAV